MNATAREGATLRIVLAWLFVGLPLAWGVWKTLLNAAKLFH